jgi:hypothetical protein
MTTVEIRPNLQVLEFLSTRQAVEAKFGYTNLGPISVAWAQWDMLSSLVNCHPQYGNQTKPQLIREAYLRDVQRMLTFMSH